MSGQGNLRTDSDWFVQNYESLRRKYAGQAIAIVNKKVIYSHKDYIIFLEHLRNNELDPTEIIVETIPDEDVSYIL